MPEPGKHSVLTGCILKGKTIRPIACVGQLPRALGKASLGNGHVPGCGSGSRVVQHPLWKAMCYPEMAKSGRKMQALQEQT